MQQDLGRIRQEIDQTINDDSAHSSGLIKSLIGVRLQILKTNEALVEQRIHALQGGTHMTVVVNRTKPDPVRAAELAKEIESQKAKLAEAKAEADRYTAGLVKAMAETSVATARNTLAMLEQQYFIAKYGLAMPPIPSGRTPASKSEPVPTAPSEQRAGDCLKIETIDSSIVTSNDMYTELAWKVDISNSCERPFGVRVTYTIYDKDEFKLDSDSENVYVPAKGTGKARGKMLVHPPEKARRMERQGASLSLR